MHHLKRARYILATLLAGMACTLSMAQYGDFGLAVQPADTASVDDIIYYGEINDMSGGYQVNDTVFNFTLYDFDGNAVELYQELAGNKPVVLVSGSVSCIRFRDVFNPEEQSQELWSARNFLFDHQDDFNWIFVYGVEAHPTDGNCPSNCPPLVFNDTTVVQPTIYGQRRWAMHDWLVSPDHDFPFTMYADNPDNSVYNHFFQRPFGMVVLNCDGTVGIRADWVNGYFSQVGNAAELLGFGQTYVSCSIDWQPEEEEENDNGGTDENDDTDGGGADDGDSDDDSGTDDDETDDDSDDDEPVDYDGPDHALEGHAGNGTASDQSEQAPTGAVLRVFPNPAQSILTVVSDAQINSLQLTDLLGRTVAQWTTVERLLTLPVADLPHGQYLFIGRTSDGATTHRRVILH